MMPREAFMQDNPDAHVAYWEGKVAHDNAADVANTYRMRLFLAIAQYSRGDELEKVRASVKQAVLALETDPAMPKAAFDLQDPTQYYAALWGLALSILFGDATPEFLHRSIGQDGIMDRLLKVTGALVAPVDKILHPQPFQQLLSVIESPKQSAAAIERYLTTWYAGMGQTPWHDTHLTQDPAFFGYWAFELAAVVKALDISDQSFAANIFYPRDLVHQRLFRTWLDAPEGEADRRANAFTAAQAQMEVAHNLLLKFFEGTGSAADEATMDQSLKSIGTLLGLSPDIVDEDPQQLQRGMLDLFKTISLVTKNALGTTKPIQNPETEDLFAMIRNFEAELAEQDEELAALTKEAEKARAAQSTGDKVAEEDRARLEAIQAGMEKLLADQSIGFEGIFEGMERAMDQFADRLGIPKQPETDIVAEVSARVSKELGEANKKNMIGPDFDWSSIWKKE